MLMYPIHSTGVMDFKTAIAAVWLLLTDRSVFEEEPSFSVRRRDVERDLSLPAAGFATVEEE